MIKRVAILLTLLGLIAWGFQAMAQDTAGGGLTGFWAKSGGGCPSGISLVNTSTGAVINGGDLTLTLPAGMQQGDVVYAWDYYGDSAGNDSTTSSSGWTDVATNPTANGQPASSIYRKVMGASPDASIVFNGGGGVNDSGAGIAVALRCVDNTTPEDAAAVRANSLDPPSVTAVTAGAWALVFAGTRADDISGTASPTGYSTIVQQNAVDSRSHTSYFAYKTGLSPGAENPAAFTGISATSVMSVTIIVRPD